MSAPAKNAEAVVLTGTIESMLLTGDVARTIKVVLTTPTRDHHLRVYDLTHVINKLKTRGVTPDPSLGDFEKWSALFSALREAFASGELIRVHVANASSEDSRSAEIVSVNIAD